MTVDEVARLLRDGALPLPGHLVAEGALPPPRVTERALREAREDGVPTRWCLPFMAVLEPPFERAVVAGCRVKGLPVDGLVEIGYGVAPAYRGRGLARSMVTALLAELAATGEVRRVAAHILPDNAASIGVARSLGFERVGTCVDPDGTEVVRWVREI